MEFPNIRVHFFIGWEGGGAVNNRDYSTPGSLLRPLIWKTTM